MKIRENVAYWCKTEKLSREFLQERQKEGIAWCDGCPASEKSPSPYFSSICYIVSKTSSFLEYETLGWFLAHGYEIVEYIGTKQESMENKIVSQPSSKDKEVTKCKATQSSILECLADLIIDTAYKMRNSQAHLERNNDNKIVEYEGNQGYPTVIEHIVQGNTVTIKLSNGKIGVANCSLEDNFSIEIGTKLAIERAYSIEKDKEEKDKEEKYVKVINIGWANTGDWGAFIGITFPQYVKYFKAHSFPENNQIYRYIGQFQPSDLLVKTYLIQDTDTSQVFLINKKGFKFVNFAKIKEKQE